MGIRNVTGIHASGSGVIVGDVVLVAGTNISLSQSTNQITINSAAVSIGDTVTGGTAGAVLFVGTGPVLAQDATNFTWDNTNKSLIAGDPGTESAGIDIDGSTFNSRLKVSDIGGTTPAQFIMHRHSTTLPSVIVGSRSNSNTSSHAAVTASQGLFQLLGAGWTGSHYDLFAGISIEVDSTGVISSTSSPGVIRFKTTPTGSNSLADALVIRQTKSVEMPGYSTGIAHLDSSGVITSSTIVNADVNASAAIAFSKLASLTSAHILVGSAGNVATDVAVTGDISLTNAGVTAYAGTVPLNKGGTGQTTKAAAFDALSPMTTSGDIIYGGASGTGTRLAKGTDGDVLTLASGIPSWAAPSGGGVTNATYVTLTTNATLTQERVLTGTSNQITITDNGAGSTVVLSTPQDIATTSSPTFGGIKLSGSGGTFTVKVNSSTVNALEDITSDAVVFQSLLESHTSGGSTGPTIAFIRSRGTASVPTAVVINDAIGFENFYGYTGNSTVGYQLAAQVQYWTCADGTTISTTSMPGRIQFFTTPDLSVTPAERVRINCTGLTTFFSNINLNGTTVYGNFGSSSGHLVLAANNSTFSDTNTGRIQIGERITVNQTFTVAGASLIDNFITFTGTITTGVAVNIYTGFNFAPTYNCSVAQVLSGSPAFKALPTTVHTVANLTDTLSYYTGFDSQPGFDSTAASGTSTAGYVIGFSATPRVLKTGAAAVVVPNMFGFATYATPFFATNIATGATVTNLVHFRSFEPVGNGGNVTNYIGFQYVMPSTANKPIITNQYAFYSDMSSGSANWNLYFTGTGKSFMQGGIRIGDASPAQPTEKLEVLGNLYLDNGGSSAELRIREPSGSGSNYFAFKAPTLAANVTVTLPNADGTAGQVLKTNGSNVWSWVTVGGSSPLTTKGDIYTYSTADDRLAVGTNGQTLVADSTQSTGLKWANTAGFTIIGSTTTVAGSSTVNLTTDGIAASTQLPFAGEIYAIAIGMNANRTAGTCTARYTLNGVADTTNTAVIDGTNVLNFYRLFATPVAFAAGDLINLQTVTSGFTPTANDALVTLFLRRT